MIIKWNTHLTVFVVSTTKIGARGTILIIEWNRHFMRCLVCQTKTGTQTILHRTDTYFHQLECPSHAGYSERHTMGTAPRLSAIHIWPIVLGPAGNANWHGTGLDKAIYHETERFGCLGGNRPLASRLRTRGPATLNKFLYPRVCRLLCQNGNTLETFRAQHLIQESVRNKTKPKTFVKSVWVKKKCVCNTCVPPI